MLTETDLIITTLLFTEWSAPELMAFNTQFKSQLI